MERSKWIQKPTPTQVEIHLEHLLPERQEAFERNKAFLLKGPVTILLLSRKDQKDAIQALRDLCGPTDPSKAEPGTLRHRFSHDSIQKATEENRGLHNAIHASDSSKAFQKEYQLWFQPNRPDSK